MLPHLLALALLSPLQLPPPAPAQPLPVQPAPLPPPAPMAVTLDEFVKNFQPVAGVHTVWIVHPKTKVATAISFTLPAGTPKVKSGKTYVTFDYGKYEAEIRFRSSGKVTVEY